MTQPIKGPPDVQQGPPSLGMPPGPFSTQPQRPTGVARALAFAQGLSGKAFVLALVVLGLQAAMPEGRRPSDLIGGFHGSTESAEMNAKREAQARYEAELANARAAAPAKWQMETQLSQTQQQAQLDALSTQQGAANLADAACLGSGLVSAFFGRDADQVAQGMKAGCGMGDRLRGNINRSLADAAQTGSGVMARGAAQPMNPLPVDPQPTAAPPAPQQPYRTAPSRYYPQGQLVYPDAQPQR